MPTLSKNIKPHKSMKFTETKKETMFAFKANDKKETNDFLKEELKKIFKTDENGNLIKIKRTIFGKTVYIPRFKWGYVILNLASTLAILAYLYEEFAKLHFGNYVDCVEDEQEKQK